MTLHKMMRTAKLSLIGFLTVVFSIRHVPAVGKVWGYIMHDAIFLKWAKRVVFAVALSIVFFHCAQCQTDTLNYSKWWSFTDTIHRQIDSFPDIRDTMEIIVMLPDWETGQVETVKGRMIRQFNGVGWHYYILRQKCEEVPRKEGKKTIYEYRCEPVYQSIDADRIANYYIKPQPRKPILSPAPER